jgi:hypothetical protein
MACVCVCVCVCVRARVCVCVRARARATHTHTHHSHMKHAFVHFACLKVQTVQTPNPTSPALTGYSEMARGEDVQSMQLSECRECGGGRVMDKESVHQKKRIAKGDITYTPKRWFV